MKRQTTNAMKHMQLLVRVQSQIQSRRIQMLENQALRQAERRTDKEVVSTLSKWTFGQVPAFHGILLLLHTLAFHKGSLSYLFNILCETESDTTCFIL